MQELLPGVFHWASFHKETGDQVHSYYLDATEVPVLIDPRLPADGFTWFSGRRPPEHVLLTNRHHYRHAEGFRQAFGATVWCHASALPELGMAEGLQGFEHGDTLPGAILALAIGVLCSDETAFYVPLTGGILAIGDALTADDGELAFADDARMGKDPDAVRQGLSQALSKVAAERSFEHLLMAHGEPILQEGRSALTAFVARH